jgi:hypothetical protein
MARIEGCNNLCDKYCRLAASLKHQSDNGGRATTNPYNYNSGPYWSQELWERMINNFQRGAQDDNCQRQAELNQTAQELTVIKNQNGTIYKS